LAAGGENFESIPWRIQGRRHQFHRNPVTGPSSQGLGVHLIMPGFVKMPQLISAEEAAREIVSGMRAGKFQIDFPRAFTRQLQFLRLLPYRWYFALIRKATGL
jgi:hypothetical protein